MVLVTTDLASLFLSENETSFREKYVDAESYVNKYNPIRIFVKELWGYQTSGATGYVFIKEVI